MTGLPDLQSGKTMVAVAQLVESRIVIPVVVGSSPISHPTGYKKAQFNELGFLLFGLAFLLPAPSPKKTLLMLADG